MTQKLFPRAAVAIAVCFSGALLSASAANADFSAEYVFGDSLSDRGNVAELENVLNFEMHGSFLGNFPNPPSNHDSFTNGPVAVQLLANSLGLNANPSLWLTGFKDPAGLFGGPAFVPGTNYAVGGASAAFDPKGGIPDINLPQQVAAFSGFVSNHADPNALYIVMIGGNDVRNAALQGTGIDAITNGVGTELIEISTLADEGAKHILVVNVPNVGLIPEFAQDDPTQAAFATQLSELYDADLAGGLEGLESKLPAGTALQDFDLFGLNASILANAPSLGFTNTTDRCFTNTPFSAATTSLCAPDNAVIDTFLYWDDIHPTAPVQALWAQGFEAVVPEPSTWAMLLIGFSGLGFAGYRRSVRARAAGA